MPQKFTLEIDTSNSSFEDENEIMHCLKDAMTYVERDASGRILDSNGNIVGHWRWEDDKDDNKPSEKVVRVRRPFGGCEALGLLVKQTEKSFVYRTQSGEVKRKGKDTKAVSAGFPNPNPHIEPCINCKDHPNSRYAAGRCSIHGNEQPCETCMMT